MSADDRRKWDARYRDAVAPGPEPSPFLVSLDAVLPRRGRALDLAGGAGRNALWLAQRGLDVTLTDISPVGLAGAASEAQRADIALTTVECDLEEQPAPPGPWDLLLCFNYLHRPLYAQIPGLLGPGGLLIVVHPTRSNLLRHPSPSARFLLEDGELPTLVQGLTVVSFDEGWGEGGRHEARLVARRDLPEG
jgi:SAM-dependent methyltransferase